MCNICFVPNICFSAYFINMYVYCIHIKNVMCHNVSGKTKHVFHFSSCQMFCFGFHSQSVYKHFSSINFFHAECCSNRKPESTFENKCCKRKSFFNFYLFTRRLIFSYLSETASELLKQYECSKTNQRGNQSGKS